jgi:hypothetical protein
MIALMIALMMEDWQRFKAEGVLVFGGRCWNQDNSQPPMMYIAIALCLPRQSSNEPFSTCRPFLVQWKDPSTDLANRWRANVPTVEEDVFVEVVVGDAVEEDAVEKDAMGVVEDAVAQT